MYTMFIYVYNCLYMTFIDIPSSGLPSTKWFLDIPIIQSQIVSHVPTTSHHPDPPSATHAFGFEFFFSFLESCRENSGISK